MSYKYLDPTPAMLNSDPLFDAIWDSIKGWDISRDNDGMYAGPSGNDARHIYDAVVKVQKLERLRDEFAMAALTGILSCEKDYKGAECVEDRIILAYEYADAALKAREIE